MDLNFELILTLLFLLSGGFWLLNKFIVKQEEGLIEFTASLAPVLGLVLFLRSFLIEPFQIPSQSMVPTLKVGDFILVNKWTYGIRLPVLRTKIIPVSLPERGDVMVFFPPHEDRYFIKRVVGLDPHPQVAPCPRLPGGAPRLVPGRSVHRAPSRGSGNKPGLLLSSGNEPGLLLSLPLPRAAAPTHARKGSGAAPWRPVAANRNVAGLPQHAADVRDWPSPRQLVFVGQPSAHAAQRHCHRASHRPRVARERE